MLNGIDLVSLTIRLTKVLKNLLVTYAFKSDKTMELNIIDFALLFSVALDPTEVNRQGPDEGTQYRSVIFYSNDEQKRIADAYVAQLEQAKVYPHKIVTQVVPLQAFYAAEGYHQNYAKIHPDNPYIMFNDAPKVANLKKEFPELYSK